LYGFSSGAYLALETAIKLDDKVKKIAIYEPPHKSNETAPEEWSEYNNNSRSSWQRIADEMQ
jgi:predicted esterase